MPKWKIFMLGEVADIKGGKRLPKGSVLTAFVNSHPYIRIRDLGQSSVLNLNPFFEYVDDETQKTISRYIVNEGDVILSIVGTIGLTGIIGESLEGANLTENCVRFVNLKGIDPCFLYYFLSSPVGQEEIKKGVVGAVQPKLPIKNILKIPISLPSIDDQRRIVGILSSIDEKIALNNRINHNLEEQIRALYKSWFVDFEPFRDDEFVESEMGMIPSSCHIQRLQDLCDVVTKGTTPTSIGFSFTDEGIPFVKVECIREDHVLEDSKFAYIDSETHSALLRSQIRPRDILFTIAGTLGRFCLMPNHIKEANTNQAVCILRVNPNTIPVDYIYSLFLGGFHVDYCSKNVQQAVQANLSLGTLKNLPVLIPSQEKLQDYTESIMPIISAMELRKEEVRLLIKCRDSILPQLMKGSVNC